MPSIKEFLELIKQTGLIKFLLRVYKEMNDDAVFTNAAAIAYAWMFAIFPFFIFLLTLTPYIPAQWRDSAMANLEVYLRDYVTPDAAAVVMKNVGEVISHSHGGLLSFGIVLTLWAASGGMSTTMTALDTAYEVEKGRNYLWRRIVAMSLTIFMTTNLLLIMLLLPIGAAIKLLVQKFYPDIMPVGLDVLFTIARYCGALILMLFLVSVLFHFGRSQRGKFTFFSPGTIFTVAGWLLTGFALRLYLSHFDSYSKTYGTVAGMVIMLLVFYLNSIVLLIGAEIDSEIVFSHRELQSPYQEDKNGLSRPA